MELYNSGSLDYKRKKNFVHRGTGWQLRHSLAHRGQRFKPLLCCRLLCNCRKIIGMCVYTGTVVLQWSLKIQVL